MKYKLLHCKYRPKYNLSHKNHYLVTMSLARLPLLQGASLRYNLSKPNPFLMNIPYDFSGRSGSEETNLCRISNRGQPREADRRYEHPLRKYAQAISNRNFGCRSMPFADQL